MAIDKGGLHYTIKVENQFSTPLDQFSSGMKEAKGAFKDFKNNVKGLGAEANRLKTALEKIEEASRRASAAAERYNRVARSRNLTRLSEAFERLAAAQNRTATSGQAAAAATASASQAARSARGSINSQARATRRAGTAADRASRGVRKFGNETQKAGTKSKGVLFSLRRLFGALALFQGARLGLNVFTGFIRQTVEFSSTIENSRLGLAALFTTVGQVSDGTGKLLSGTEALNEALRISDDQLVKLRVEGLRTAATFDQLAETFQVGVGPGLAAGLNLDEVRKFTVQVSQAAAALGVEQNQLSEEIRSILSGTIQQRTTRLAAALGITNEDIRKAKEAGNLFKFLQDQFGGFTIAGEKALDTFSARVTNALDALLLLSSTGGATAFQGIKDALGDIAAGAVAIDAAAGTLVANSQAVAVFSEIFENVADSIATFRNLGQVIPIEQLQQAAALIGQVVNLLSSGLGIAIRGVVAGVSDLALIFSSVAVTIRDVIASVTGVSNIFEGSADETARLLALLVEVGVVVGGLKLALTTVAALFGTILGPILVIAVSLAVIKTKIDDVVKAVTGLEDVNYAAGAAILVKEFSAAAEEIGVRLAAALKSAAIAGARKWASLLPEFLGGGAATDASFDALQNILDQETEAQVAVITKSLEKYREEVRAAATKAGSLDNLATEGGRALEAAEFAGKKLLAPVEAIGNDLRKSFKEILSKATGIVTETGKTADNLGTAAGKAQDLANAAKAVERATKASATNAAKLTREIDAQREKNALLAAEIDAVGSPGPGAGLAKVAIRRRFEAERQAKAEKKITDQIAEQLILTGGVGEGAKALLDTLYGENAALVERNALVNQGLDLEAELINARQEASSLTGAGSLTGGSQGGVALDMEGALSDQRDKAQGFVSAFSAIGGQIFDAMLLDEQESGEAIKSYGDFFDSLMDIVGDFFSELSLKQALFGLVQGLLGGGNLGTGVPGGGAAASGGGVGFARGGHVKSGGRPSFAHSLAQGFAEGGRPAGVASSDTVAAWLTPGEHVIQKSSVGLYGRDFVDAVNRARINPFEARALVKSRAPRYAPPKIGYATGGQVAARPAASSEGGGMSQAVILSDAQSFERLLHGGKGALLRFMRDNSASMNSALRGGI